MTEQADHLRSQARQCRRLAKSVLREADRAMLVSLAEGFDKAAEEQEVKDDEQ